MKVFVTGATGWIGSGVVRELLAAGHDVTGLTRSDSGVRQLSDRGARPLHATLDDADALARAAQDADAVVHLGYNHDFTRVADAAQTERAALTAMCDVLVGSDRPFLFASATGLIGPGHAVTEDEVAEQSGPDAARGGGEALARDYAGKGVRTVALRFPATTHGDGERHGFIPTSIAAARDAGYVGYVGDGASRWPAVHRDDAARAVVAALSASPAGSAIHPVAEEGVATLTIAEALARNLDLPLKSVSADDMQNRLGFVGMFWSMDVPASSALTRERLSWTPTEIDLIADIDAGHYFR